MIHRPHSRSFAFLLLLFLLIPQVLSAQAEVVEITRTTRWEVNQNLCPQSRRCGRIWQLSGDGNLLYVFMVDNHQLFVISSDNQIAQYDLSLLPGVTSADFYYVPYDKITILSFDGLARKIYLYDLETRTISDRFPGQSFTNCTTVFAPPFRSFMRPIFSSRLLTCGLGSLSNDNRNLSITDLSTGQTEEIASLDSPLIGRVESWQRVTLGHDGAVYMTPLSVELLKNLVPDYDSLDQATVLVLRRAPGETKWSVIAINEQDIQPQALGQLVAVDAESNLYFYNFFAEGSINGIRYSKIDRQGKVKWILTNEDFGGNLFLMDVTDNGHLIMLDGGPQGNDSTIGSKIYEYTISFGH